MLTILRLAYGVIGRLPRVTASGGATFNDYYVPEGVSLSPVPCSFPL